jgi:hypothetical protein
MKLVLTFIVGLALVGSGCGYKDDNPEAAALVAQSYLDAYTARNRQAICRVAAPEVQAALTVGHPSCEAGIQLLARYPRLKVGRVRKVEPAPPLNPRYAVAVPAQPGREIVLGRYGSTWRVVYGGPAP